MTPPVIIEQIPQTPETEVPEELTSFQPPNCVNTIKLLQRIAEEGEDAWLEGER